MHFQICNFPENKLSKDFIVFDKEPFNANDFNFISIKEISLEELKSTYSDLPLLDLNELLLKSLRPKERTVTHILAEHNIESLDDLELEYSQIQNKLSTLSRHQRDLVIQRYTELNA